MIVADNADDLFDKVIAELLSNKYSVKDSHDVHGEIINANLVLTNPTANTMCNCKREMPLKYALAELLWYNSRKREFASIHPYSKFWSKISDDGKTVNSNYGWCIHDKYGFDQWIFARELLRKDPLTRQAVIHIKEPRELLTDPTKDVNCTIALQFFVRNNKLDMITTMRSNDVWLGLPYDLFNFTCMQMQMAMELEIEVGTYYHNAGSLHLYERDVGKIKL